jgi:hypothetical protein
MRAIVVTIGTLLVAGLANPARAEIKWSVLTRPYLLARTTGPEGDATLRAICRNPNAIEVRIGAEENVGKGNGEPVTLRFSGNGTAVSIKGVSRRSEDYQMTGGTELVTELQADDAFFKLLTSGQPVKVSGSLQKTTTWVGAEMTEAVKKFFSTCTRQ